MNNASTNWSMWMPLCAVVDGKNTLQSFDLHGTPVSLEPPEILPDTVRFALPDGQLITGKNTLQSFDAAGREGRPSQRTPMDPPDAFADDMKPSSNGALPPPNPVGAVTPPSTTVVAVAVEADIVYVEVSPEAAPTKTTWYKSRSTLSFVTIIVLLLAVVLGVSIGLSSRNGSSSNDPSNSSNSAPISAPIAVVMSTNAHITAMPTLAPIAIDPNITIRAAVLTSYINNITLTNQKISANGTSPESKDLSWLIYNDTTLNTSAMISEDDPIAERSIGFQIWQKYPLLVMWFQQQEDMKWPITAGWLVESSECAWYGIECGNRYVTYFFDVFNFSHGGFKNAVTQILFKLLGSYLGTFPVDIGLLTNLEHFKIVNTYGAVDNEKYLQGNLPESIGQWTVLTYFNVGSNRLKGTLPDSIGQWTALTYFDVGLNDLTGALPESISQWSALTYFNVNSNALTGTLPDSIGKWTALTHFNGNNNYLTGTLPSSIGQWTVLTYIDVSNNAFNGTLPDSIGQWTALIYFDFSVTVLTGALPNIIRGFSGTLPESIGQWTDLIVFNIYENALTGLLPD
jgi:hypothetical protein